MFLLSWKTEKNLLQACRWTLALSWQQTFTASVAKYEIIFEKFFTERRKDGEAKLN